MLNRTGTGMPAPGCVLLLLLASAPTDATDWRASNVELLYGRDFELGSSERTTVTVEHAQGWAWGDFYGFADAVFRDDIGTEVYNENSLQMSLGWLAQRPIALGPVTDVDLSVAFHVGDEPSADPFRAMLAGLSFDLRAPGFRFAQFDVHAYKNDSVNGVGVQFTTAWDAEFRIGRLPLRFRGFADVLSPATNRGDRWQFLTQPQLLLDVGTLAGAGAGHLYLGVEYSYWRNKFGVKGVDESVAQAMLMVDF